MTRNLIKILFSVKMINVVGVISVVIFYILILAVGMWAARKNSGIEGDQEVKNAFPVWFDLYMYFNLSILFEI